MINSMQKVIALSPAEEDTVTSLFKEKIYKKGEFVNKLGLWQKDLCDSILIMIGRKNI
jgi:hypothetical protein